MRLFTQAEAAHFFTNFTAESGDSQFGIDDFYDNHLRHTASVSENTQRFNQYRACLAREAERSLFLSISQYRRSLDLMMSSSAHWAFVTLYYSSWYAAQSILAMYGGRVFYQCVMDVGIGTPGAQRLDRRQIGNKIGQESVGSRGSHKVFWEIYYNSVTSLAGIVPATLTFAVNPHLNDSFWQIDLRNNYNYRTYLALDLQHDFTNSFVQATYPLSLPGNLRTMNQVAEEMLEFACLTARNVGLATDTLGTYGPQGLRTQARKRIYGGNAPALVNRSRKGTILSSLP